jgi:hypothetical protein
MRLTLSYMSSNRQLGKALRRVRPLLAETLSSLARVPVGPPYGDVVLWLTDNPPMHYEEVQATESFLSVRVGYPGHLSWRESDQELAGVVMDQLAFFVRASRMQAEEQAQLLAALKARVP